MAQTGYTPIQLYYSTTATAVPTAGNLASGELAINITDGKLYYKNNSGVVTLLAGATAGPAGGSNTQVQFNSSGVLAGSANMTFDGTTLSAGGFSTVGLSTLVKTVKIGDSNFSGVAVFEPSTPAKLYIGNGTVTDTTSAIGATNAAGAVASLAVTPIAATNTSVTYTNASTLYIAGAPSAGTNVTLTNPYALFIASGNAYYGSIGVTQANSASIAHNIVSTGGGANLTLSAATGAGGFSPQITFSSSGTGKWAIGGGNIGSGGANDFGMYDYANAKVTYSVLAASGNMLMNTNLLFADNTFDIGASGTNRPRNLYLAGGIVAGSDINTAGDYISTSGRLSLYRAAGGSYIDFSSGQTLTFRTETSSGGGGAVGIASLNAAGFFVNSVTGATNTGDNNTIVAAAITTGAYASSYGAGLQFQITNSSGGYSGSRIVSRLNADNNTANLIFQARNYGFSDSMVLDQNGNLGVGASATGKFLAYQATAIQNNQGAYGSSGTFQTGNGPLTLGGGSSPRGIGVLINANRDVGTTLTYGNNFETFGLLAVANVGTGGGYGTTGVAGYAESDGGVYGLRADAKTTSAGGSSIAVGLYVGSVTGSSTNYGVYVNDTSASNYFGGSVGLGLSNPSTYGKLAVAGNIAQYGNVASGAELGRIAWFNTTTNYDVASIRTIIGAGQVNRGELQFYTNNGANQLLRLAIDYTGNIQVDNAELNAPKFINFAANSTGVGYGGLTWYNYQWSSAKRAEISSGPSSGGLNSGYLSFSTGTGGITERLHINSSGFVGLNTNNPTAGFTNYQSTAELTSGNASGVGFWNVTNTTVASNNATTDVLRMLNANGAALNGYYAGHVYLAATGASGANSYSAIYVLTTTSNGVSPATFTLVSSTSRGTNPVSSVAIAADGGGGAVKVQVTWINDSGVVTGGGCVASFAGLAG